MMSGGMTGGDGGANGGIDGGGGGGVGAAVGGPGGSSVPTPLHQSSTRPWPGPSQHAFCASQILRYSTANSAHVVVPLRPAKVSGEASRGQIVASAPSTARL